MNCPTCGYQLQKLSVTTNSGGKFEIDHCGRCGGTWFDPYEINRIPYSEVMRVAHLTVLPQNNPPVFEVKKCPHCQQVLNPSTTDMVPRSVSLLRCPKCHGVWASQKALEIFKQNQDETVREYKTKNRIFPSLAVAFVPAIFTLLLFMATFVTVRRLQEQKDNRTQAENLVNSLSVNNISPTAAGITFRTGAPVKSYLSYGPSTLEYREIQVSTQKTTSHAIILKDLKPNSAYIYQITVISDRGGKFTTDPQAFRTGNQ